MGARALVAVVLLAASAACGPARVRAPYKAPFDTTRRAAIWQSAVVVMQERNYPIALLDEPSGTITTGEVTGGILPCGLMDCFSRESVSLTVSPTGTLIVNVNRLLASPTARDQWFVPADKRGVEAVEAVQREIAETIQARAGAMPVAAPPTAAPPVAPAAPSAP